MVLSPARSMAMIGRVLVTTGLLMVAFAGFQLWGTGLAEARAQDELSAEFEARLHSATATPPVSAPATEKASTGLPTPTTASIGSSGLQPAPGQAAGRIIIPALDLDKVFVEGVERDHLRSGPGRYPDNPWPGQAGNAAIAGHRTTYGAPFLQLDRLQPGDDIIVVTIDGRFRYTVQGHDDGKGGTVGHFIVDPAAVDVLDDRGDNRLTLTACHPAYSAAQRIIVTALLADDPVPAVPAEWPEPDVSDRRGAAADGQPTGSPGDGGGDDGQIDDGRAGSDSGADDGGADDESRDAISSAGLTTSIESSLGWQLRYMWPTTAGAALTAVVAAAAWWMARRRTRWVVYAAAVAPFLASMFWWFTNLNKLLPAV